MFDITSALNFVDRHGDFLNKEAIKKIRNKPFDMFGVAFYLLYDQNDDGGFPIFRIQNAPSSIFETCSRLSVLIDFELTKGLAVKNAVNFLLRKQKEEGFWEEPENLPEEVPDWLRPGKIETRIFETVNVLDVLLSLNSIPQEKLKLGLAFLRKNLQDNNLLKGFVHSSFILVSILCKINDDENIIRETADFISKLEINKSYISIPIRPPAEQKVKIPREETLNKTYNIFREKDIDTEYLIGYEGNEFTSTGDIREDILSITSVHPIREDGMRELLRKANVNWEIVEELIERKDIVEVIYRDKRFYIRNLSKTMK